MNEERKKTPPIRLPEYSFDTHMINGYTHDVYAVYYADAYTRHGKNAEVLEYRMHSKRYLDGKWTHGYDQMIDPTIVRHARLGVDIFGVHADIAVREIQQTIMKELARG